MAKARVYFTREITPQAMDRLYDALGIRLSGKTAVKISTGEPGGHNFLQPALIGPLTERLHGTIVECNTAYEGRRNTTQEHWKAIQEHGFLDIAPCDIMDETGELALPVTNGMHLQENFVGAHLRNYDSMLVLSHFKGHMMGGFGGALKNLGMGCASVGGKLELHSASQPIVDRENCKSGNICVKHCAHDAIHLDGSKIATIDYEKCVGCGQCVALCQYDAAVMGDGDTSERLNYKIAEYSKAVLLDKPNFHISFIMNVSPECDCWNHNDAAIVPDLGIAASFDPVALDKACADIVINAPILETGNRLSDSPHHDHLEGCDKFHIMHPETNWQAGLEHAEKIGLGTQEYELITV